MDVDRGSGGDRRCYCGGSLWATCIIVCALSSPSISISFIGFLIHLISISIPLDNYVIINSKSDTTQKYRDLFDLELQNSKTTFPSELVILPTLHGGVIEERRERER